MDKSRLSAPGINIAPQVPYCGLRSQVLRARGHPARQYGFGQQPITRQTRGNTSRRCLSSYRHTITCVHGGCVTQPRATDIASQRYTGETISQIPPITAKAPIQELR